MADDICMSAIPELWMETVFARRFGRYPILSISAYNLSQDGNYFLCAVLFETSPLRNSLTNRNFYCNLLFHIPSCKGLQNSFVLYKLNTITQKCSVEVPANTFRALDNDVQACKFFRFVDSKHCVILSKREFLQSKTVVLMTNCCPNVADFDLVDQPSCYATLIPRVWPKSFDKLSSTSNSMGSKKTCALCTKKERKITNSFQQCSECKVVFYCSPSCKETQQHEHRFLCEKISELARSQKQSPHTFLATEE